MAATSTVAPSAKSIKMRERDYEAAREATREFPLSIIDVFTAWRILWDSAPEKERLRAIRRIRERQPA